jgi:hypothetical protein
MRKKREEGEWRGEKAERRERGGEGRREQNNLVLTPVGRHRSGR